MIVHPTSLAATVEAVNEVLFAGRTPAAEEVEEFAGWVLGRQLTEGPLAGAFAPTEKDLKAGVRLFTGELLKTHLAARNILTTEVARALFLLVPATPGVREALERANRWLLGMCFAGSCVIGECAHSTVGWMRYLAAGALDDAEGRLEAHLQVLAQHRDRRGRWKRFPFYYTLLALSEIDLPAAVAEMCYAAPACERSWRRWGEDTPMVRRQKAILERALAAC
jgi:hypothetical protein